MLRPITWSLLVVGLAIGCSSSSGSSRDAHPTPPADGPSAKSDSPTPDAGPAPANDAPALVNDAPAPPGDSSVSPDRPATIPDAPTSDRVARDALGLDTRDASSVDAPASDGSARDALGADTRDASSVDGDFVCPAPFDACGCGCCGAPRNVACYYPTVGESLQSIKDKDIVDRNSTNCAAAGCSAGTRYVCCMPAAPEPTSAATYSASGWSGDMDHLTIDKVGTECAQLMLSMPATTRTGFHLDSTTRWGLMAASFGACMDAAIPASVEGGLGTIAIRREGSGCVVDVHVTLFDLSTTGEMKTARLDADGLAVGGMGISCPQ